MRPGGNACHWVRELETAEGPICSACAATAAREGAGATAGEARLPVTLNEKDLRHLQRVDFGIQMDGVSALQILAVLQLACRHPQFQGPSRATAERFGRALQKEISITKHLTALAEAGWHPDAGVPVAEPSVPGESASESVSE